MQPNTEESPSKMVDLKEIATLLVKRFDYHEGIFELSFSIQIAVGQVGPTPDSQFPGALFGISGVGLIKTDKAGLHTVDAAEVNPQPLDRRTEEKEKPRRKSLKK